MRHLICTVAELTDGGEARRFELDLAGERVPAFAQRWQGQVYAYVNRCAHIPIELDWNPGKLLDDSGQYLICATHGALYAPDSGECLAGPCAGQRLRALAVCEDGGNVYLEIESNE
ncbi:MAG: (2Fe-2S)-binding protein [Candidatus Dactylopiibacterium carminicum]|uniref:(2Fe-2S)-binding protein n=1 Tax=Candidatus Dactylopiibacterium carminicum TaxID=857335 RepID=A0A272ESQ4_9RHOO|nr:Rieske 2Fe-2S domain-containing protein [Candidatus Dactylopiibacterium carminicum]KAF7599105.1 (2Fe-2S)-binding protein [Candidatus Dactylopiibacterium carminicum]PAS93134.1 MAG: (2Fe-2S)-binding protein [Candidatus Dactylopiibacterium carminicum]PAS96894.1 MAG: (2Fe-2S)-binding protein [Candidatus Dactylopiibacterium carminicum]PAS99118.1 MAG: (2Fe-2S)-binding protein [Candidatus Dactylopiibacterium carminicum]